MHYISPHQTLHFSGHIFKHNCLPCTLIIFLCVLCVLCTVVTNNHQLSLCLYVGLGLIYATPKIMIDPFQRPPGASKRTVMGVEITIPVLLIEDSTTLSHTLSDLDNFRVDTHNWVSKHVLNSHTYSCQFDCSTVCTCLCCCSCIKTVDKVVEMLTCRNFEACVIFFIFV